MTRSSYRCVSGHTTRRFGSDDGIKCPKCKLLAMRVDPTPGPRAAPPEEQRAELRIRPLAQSIERLGEEQAREIGRAAIDRAAKRRNAKARRA